jgi:hypothetical protein
MAIVKPSDLIILAAANVAPDDELFIRDVSEALEANQSKSLPLDNLYGWMETVMATSGGWLPAGETWTYGSSTTVIIAGDKTAKYSRGMKVKLTQTTVKYFYITGVTGGGDAPTTLTLRAGTDYTVADAAITSPFYSMMDKPQGFPDSFGYSFTPTSATGAFTTVAGEGRFNLINGLVWVRAAITITTNGTAAGYINFVLPIASTISYRDALNGMGIVTATGAFHNSLNGTVVTSSARVYNSAGGYPGADARFLMVNGIYKL